MCKWFILSSMAAFGIGLAWVLLHCTLLGCFAASCESACMWDSWEGGRKEGAAPDLPPRALLHGYPTVTSTTSRWSCHGSLVETPEILDLGSKHLCPAQVWCPQLIQSFLIVLIICQVVFLLFFFFFPQMYL